MLLENYRRASPAIRWAARKIVRSRKVRWIAVSAAVKEQLTELGAEDSRISVIPAFIPPSANVGDAASLPAEMRSFLDAHRPILSVYGWQLSRDNEGVDLYGIDMCIDLLAKLKPDYPEIGLIACIPVIPDPDYFKELKRRTKDRGLEHNLFFYDRSLPEAYPLWQASDIYLRPTTTDGDAVAVREALSLGVPVVASDASRRPDGVVLFPKRDGESFAKAVGETLQNPRAAKEAAKASVQNDFFAKVLDIYREAAQKPLDVNP
jgi:glycosyltransferase involved in cell wall biosynthesis